MVKKIETLDWKSFCKGNLVSVSKSKKLDTALKVAGVVTVAILAYDVLSPLTAFASGPEVIDPAFQEKLADATKPIHEIIRGFAHELYAIFMLWGGIEALIGKPEQGFSRMKTATLAYILLFWIPTIVDMVNSTLPR